MGSGFCCGGFPILRPLKGWRGHSGTLTLQTAAIFNVRAALTGPGQTQRLAPSFSGFDSYENRNLAKEADPAFVRELSTKLRVEFGV